MEKLSKIVLRIQALKFQLAKLIAIFNTHIEKICNNETLKIKKIKSFFLFLL